MQGGALVPSLKRRFMPYGLYMSAEGAHAQATRLEVIAHNLANVDTTGFKRELAIFQSRYAEEIENGAADPASGTINDLGGGIRVLETRTDFAPGPLKHTGVATDAALRNEGFFVVSRDNELFLTRAGSFHVTAQGELVTQYGGRQYAVVDDSYAPIVLDQQAPWELTESGAVRQAGGLTHLALVKPQSYGDLVRMGENLFRPLADPVPLATTDRNLAPGYLEGSSVEPTTEMVSMIEASRVLESNLKMMQTQDEMLGGLVNRLMRA